MAILLNKHELLYHKHEKASKLIDYTLSDRELGGNFVCTVKTLQPLCSSELNHNYNTSLSLYSL